MDPRPGPKDVVKRIAALPGNRTAILFDKSHLVIQPGSLFCMALYAHAVCIYLRPRQAHADSCQPLTTEIGAQQAWELWRIKWKYDRYFSQ